MSQVHVKIECDGGAAPNPGHAAIGYTIEIIDDLDKTQIEKIEGKEYLGNNLTNNHAEYMSLIKVLEAVFSCIEGNDKNEIISIHVSMDSNLVVQQINGKWKVKNSNIKKLHTHASSLIEGLREGHVGESSHFSIQHIPRAKNSRADRLVNEARKLALRRGDDY